MEIWAIIAIYIAVMAGVGFVSMKKADSLAAFTVGGRGAGPWMSAFAYGTTYFSAVIFIGYAGRSGWNFGLWAVLIGVGNALIGTLLAWLVLAERTRAFTRRYKIKTMPEFFRRRYDSNGMKIFAALIIFIFLTPYSASVYSGLSYLCESVLGISYQWCMIGMAVITALYVVLGGYLAELKADFVQGIVMLIGCLLMVGYLLFSPQVGGFAGLSQIGELVEVPNTFKGGVVDLLALILLTSFGVWGMPQMIHKFYGVADKAAIKRGTVISTVFAVVISVGAYFVGSLTRVFFDNQVPMANGAPQFDRLIPDMLRAQLPTLLLGLILVMVIAASVSTLAGIVLTASSSLSIDLFKDTLFKNTKSQTTLLITRVIVVLYIFASVLIASVKSPILTLMAFSWGAIAGSFLAPYMLGLYWRGVTRAGAWAGMLGGFGTLAVQVVASGFNTARSPLFGVVAMAASFVFTVGVSLVTQRYEQAFLDEVMPQEKAA